MHNTTGGDSFTPFKQSLIVRLILLPFGLIFRLWTRSIRFDYAEENGLEELGRVDGALVFFFGIIDYFLQVNGIVGFD